MCRTGAVGALFIAGSAAFWNLPEPCWPIQKPSRRYRPIASVSRRSAPAPCPLANQNRGAHPSARPSPLHGVQIVLLPGFSRSVSACSVRHRPSTNRHSRCPFAPPPPRNSTRKFQQTLDAMSGSDISVLQWGSGSRVRGWGEGGRGGEGCAGLGWAGLGGRSVGSRFVSPCAGGGGT